MVHEHNSRQPKPAGKPGDPPPDDGAPPPTAAEQAEWKDSLRAMMPDVQ